MDLEDGFNKGWYTYDTIKASFVDIEGMDRQFKKIEEENNTNGIEITRVAALRIYLLQRLVELASTNFLKNLEQIQAGEYNLELIDDDPTQLAKCLRSFSWNNIFSKKEITSLELTGHSVISGLLDYYIDFLFHESEDYRRRAEGLISNGIRRVALIENGLSEKETIEKLEDYYKLRIIVDYISGMTDQFALNIFQRLSGQRIN
jgi:dGTPase